MKFFKQHWFKILILLPMIPVGILIYFLDQFTGIDSSLRLLVTFVLGTGAWALFFLGCTLELGKGNIEKRKIQFNIKNFKFGIVEILRVLYSVLIIVVCYGASVLANTSMRIYDVLEEVSAPEEVTYVEMTYSFVTMSNFNIDDVRNYGRVGIFPTADEATEIATDQFLSEQDFIPNFIPTVFDSPIEMINALYNNEIDSMIIASNFAQVFNDIERFEEIEMDTMILDSFTIEIEIAERADIDPGEPFSILLLGLAQAGRNDLNVTSTINTFMLLTVNLENLSFTITSIPRDSFVWFPAWGRNERLSVTNTWGTRGAIETVEHLLDMEIPYYVKINFTGFMSLIDTLGGIEVDVPHAFHEQDSRLRFGEHTIYVEAGLQRLDAEKALAFARHRNARNDTGITGDDITRVGNQQLIFEAMLREMLAQTTSINDVLALLEAGGEHIETNLRRHELMTIAQYMLTLLQGRSGSELMDEVHFINMTITGEPEEIFLHGHNAWISHPHWWVIEEARHRMRVNLGLERPEFEFKFQFNGFERPRHQWGQPNNGFNGTTFMQQTQPYAFPVETQALYTPLPPPQDQQTLPPSNNDPGGGNIFLNPTQPLDETPTSAPETPQQQLPVLPPPPPGGGIALPPGIGIGEEPTEIAAPRTNSE